ncbi:hypothetical protein QO009_003299 [Brevibacillus aydinogluensis]|jgi:hypothetical protein|nr:MULTISPECIES: hypothetical protein [Brevibacillus]MDT3417404.1 hypothetical protein [Brevibacillus aydinogluensis]
MGLLKKIFGKQGSCCDVKIEEVKSEKDSCCNVKIEEMKNEKENYGDQK